MAITHTQIQSTLITNLNKEKTVDNARQLIATYLKSCAEYAAYDSEFADTDKISKFKNLFGIAMLNDYYTAAIFIAYECIERFKPEEDKNFFSELANVKTKNLQNLLHHVIAHYHEFVYNDNNGNVIEKDILTLIQALNNQISYYSCGLHYDPSSMRQLTLNAVEAALHHNRMNIFKNIIEDFGGFFNKIPTQAIGLLQSVSTVEIVEVDGESYLIPALENIARKIESQHANPEKEALIFKFEKAIADWYDANPASVNNPNALLYPWYKPMGIFIGFFNLVPSTNDKVKMYIELMDNTILQNNPQNLPAQVDVYYQGLADARTQDIDSLIAAIDIFNKKLAVIISHYDPTKNSLPTVKGATEMRKWDTTVLHFTFVLGVTALIAGIFAFSILATLILVASTPKDELFDSSNPQSLHLGVYVDVMLGFLATVALSAIAYMGIIVASYIRAVLHDKNLKLPFFSENAIKELSDNLPKINAKISEYMTLVGLECEVDSNPQAITLPYLLEVQKEYKAIRAALEASKGTLLQKIKENPRRAEIVVPDIAVGALVREIPSPHNANQAQINPAGEENSEGFMQKLYSNAKGFLASPTSPRGQYRIVKQASEDESIIDFVDGSTDFGTFSLPDDDITELQDKKTNIDIRVEIADDSDLALKI